MSSADVGQSPAKEPTHMNRKDPSYVGISCTNYGYTDYSRQSRNFSPVSRVALDPPAEGAPFATALTNNTYHSVSAICSPANEIRIESVFEAASKRQNGGTDRPSMIAQRIQSLYGEKTKEEFKKRSKSAGPLQRNPYEPNFKQGLLELAEKFDPEKEELKPSNFPGSVREKTAFVEKLLKKDVKEGVKPLEELKKPPKFEIPSRKKSDEYYKEQREIEKQKALQFSQRLKEAEEKRKAREKIEAEQRRVREEEQKRLDEEQRRREEEERASHVETIPQYITVEPEQPQIVETVIVNTSFGSNDSLAETDQQEAFKRLEQVDSVGADEVDRTDVSQVNRESIDHTSSHQQQQVKEIITTTVQSSESHGDNIVTQHTTTTTSVTTSTVVEQVFIPESVEEVSNAESLEEKATHETQEKESRSSERDSTTVAPGTHTEEVMAGREFLVKLDDAEERIRKRVKITEEYVKETHSEEIHGRLRAAIGKGNLLIAQKCTQFRGLCEKNLREPKEGEFPTTRGDLEGFWDMITIQIDQMLDTFDEIEALRANNWKEPERSAETPSPSKSTASPAKKKLPNPLRPRNGSGSDKQREEARKRLLEAKKAAKQRTEAEDVATN